MLVEGAFENGMGADVMAALHEMKPGDKPVNLMHDAESRGRAWWVGLKRKLYGTDQRFTQPIDRPIVLESSTAQTLRAGSETDAGLVSGTREKLDVLLKEWAEKSGEAFTVCVARNGVVVIDGAYGTRDKKPMTRETPSIVYSISKAISGTAIMMAVDQGVVSLEDTPSRFLPPFAGATGKQPTIRQLFTHTAGLWGHWGDEQHDLEESVAGYLPNLKIGQGREYNGASLALGCKILEQVSGESLPEFYEKHIFGPLEMKDTTSTSCSWRTWTTAADLAKLGQMLLNGGAYGNKVFISQETCQQMLPHKLVKELSPDTTEIWGIGLHWMNPEKTVYGHGSASSSTFRVDPAEKLVITMARNAAGERFGDYHKQFLDLIYAGIQK